MQTLNNHLSRMCGSSIIGSNHWMVAAEVRQKGGRWQQVKGYQVSMKKTTSTQVGLIHICLVGDGPG